MPEIMEWFREEGIALGKEEGIALGKVEGIALGKHLGIQQGIQQGMQQGIQQGDRTRALHDARKMCEHGIAWNIITDVTGIQPEDLA